MDILTFEPDQQCLSRRDVCMFTGDHNFPSIGVEPSDNDRPALPEAWASRSTMTEGASARPAVRTSNASAVVGDSTRRCSLHPSLTPSLWANIVGSPNGWSSSGRHVNFNRYFCSAKTAPSSFDKRTAKGSVHSQTKLCHPAFPVHCKRVAQATRTSSTTLAGSVSSNSANHSPLHHPQSATVSPQETTYAQAGSMQSSERHFNNITNRYLQHPDGGFYGVSHDLFDQLAREVTWLSENSQGLSDGYGHEEKNGTGCLDACSDCSEIEGSDSFSSTSGSSDLLAIDSRPAQLPQRFPTLDDPPRTNGMMSDQFGLYSPFSGINLAPYRRQQLPQVVPLPPAHLLGQKTKKNHRKVRRRVKEIKVQRAPLDPSNADVIPPSLQLWEFVLHLLELKKYKTAIFWTEKENGVFHISEPEFVAGEWGKYREVPAMNYDKMSRALRYYYERQILDKIGGRMMYKFNASVMRQVKEIREEKATKHSTTKRRRKQRSSNIN